MSDAWYNPIRELSKINGDVALMCFFIIHIYKNKMLISPISLPEEIIKIGITGIIKLSKVTLCQDFADWM